MSLSSQKEIASHLRPLIEAHGFQFVEMDEEDCLNLDFQRVIKPEWHFLSLQFASNGLNRYVLEAGKCTERGVLYAGQHIPPDSAGVGCMPIRARLQPRPGHSTRYWFKTDSLAGLLRPGRALKTAVQQVTALFPQLDVWLRTGKAGDNIRVLDFSSGRTLFGSSQK